MDGEVQDEEEEEDSSYEIQYLTSSSSHTGESAPPVSHALSHTSLYFFNSLGLRLLHLLLKLS